MAEVTQCGAATDDKGALGLKYGEIAENEMGRSCGPKGGRLAS